MIRTLRVGLPVALVVTVMTVLTIGTAQEPPMAQPASPVPLPANTPLPPGQGYPPSHGHDQPYMAHDPHHPGVVDHHMPPGHLPFGNMVLVISTDLPNKPGAILENVMVYSLGSRDFLWGEVPLQLEKPWKQTVTAPVLISIDHITQIVPYPTVEEAMKALGMKSKQ